MKQFIGENPHVDDNWDQLIHDRYFYITESEAKAHFGKDYKKWYHDQAGWLVGYEMCLSASVVAGHC